MTRCGRLHIVLLSLLWLVVAVPAPAQVRRETDAPGRNSRNDNDVDPGVLDPEGALARRLGLAKDYGDAERLAASLLKNPDLLQKILEQRDLVEKVRNDPKVNERLVKDLASNPSLRKTIEGGLKNLTPEDKAKLQKALGPKPPDMGPKPQIVDPTPPDMGPKPPTTPPSGNTEPEPKPHPSKPSTSESNERSWIDRQFLKQGTKFAEYLDTIGDGEDGDTVRNLLRDMAGSRAWSTPAGDGPLAKMLQRVNNTGKEIDFDKLFSGDLSGAVRKVKFPNMPSFNLPKWGGFGPSHPSGPARPSTSFAPSEGTGTAVVWFLVVVVVLILLAKGRGWIGVTTGVAGELWRIGPWPVQPQQVRTRGDLIRAFEYLAFLRLGLDARPRNHLDLAERLAGSDTAERRAAAERLARLYERARYAPEAESLPEAEVSVARQDLILLAGVAAA